VGSRRRMAIRGGEYRDVATVGQEKRQRVTIRGGNKGGEVATCSMPARVTIRMDPQVAPTDLLLLPT
jgi:hypothetical protein